MKKEVTYAEFLAKLPQEQRTELDKLTTKVTKQATEGSKASVAAGETLFAVRNLLAKAGAKGQFSNYCREQNILRQTAYNYIRTYQWEKLVPAEFKAVAEKCGKTLDEVAQNTIIRIALGDKPGTVAEAEKAITETAPESSDPLADAIKRAAAIIVKAFNGELDSAAALANLPKYEGLAKEEMDAILRSVNASLANVVQPVRFACCMRTGKTKAEKVRDAFTLSMPSCCWLVRKSPASLTMRESCIGKVRVRSVRFLIMRWISTPLGER